MCVAVLNNWKYQTCCGESISSLETVGSKTVSKVAVAKKCYEEMQSETVESGFIIELKSGFAWFGERNNSECIKQCLRKYAQQKWNLSE